MPILTGLEETIHDIECRFFRRTDRALRLLDLGFAVTAAGDNGAINIWKVWSEGSEWDYHCKSMRFCQTKDYQIFKTKQEIIPWLKSWLRKIK